MCGACTNVRLCVCSLGVCDLCAHEYVCMEQGGSHTRPSFPRGRHPPHCLLVDLWGPIILARFPPLSSRWDVYVVWVSALNFPILISLPVPSRSGLRASCGGEGCGS